MSVKEVSKKAQKKQDEFVRYYLELTSSFFDYLKKTRETLDEEDIHQLRLSIKRLRVIWTLIESVSESEWIKDDCFKVVKKLFSDAGAIREAQINMGLVKDKSKYGSAVFSEYLREEIERTEIDLRGAIDAFDQSRLEEINKGLLLLFRDLKDETIISRSQILIQEKLDDTLKHRKHINSDKKLHKVRINLKAVYEILTILNQIDPDRAQKHKVIRKELKLMNDELGNWHDITVLIGSLKEFRKKPDNGVDRDSLKELIQKFKSDKKKERKKILKKLDQLTKNGSLKDL